jgi:hypothetical protein
LLTAGMGKLPDSGVFSYTYLLKMGFPRKIAF